MQLQDYGYGYGYDSSYLGDPGCGCGCGCGCGSCTTQVQILASTHCGERDLIAVFPLSMITMVRSNVVVGAYCAMQLALARCCQCLSPPCTHSSNGGGGGSTHTKRVYAQLVVPVPPAAWPAIPAPAPAPAATPAVPAAPGGRAAATASSRW